MYINQYIICPSKLYCGITAIVAYVQLLSHSCILDTLKYKVLVANSNSSFYSGWSLSHSVTSHVKGWEVQIVDRALGGPFGSERFSKDKRFMLMMGY